MTGQSHPAEESSPAARRFSVTFPTLGELDAVPAYAAAARDYLARLDRRKSLDGRGIQEILARLRGPLAPELERPEIGSAWIGIASGIIGRINRLQGIAQFVPQCFITNRISAEEWATLEDDMAAVLQELYDQLLKCLPDGIELRFNPHGQGFFLTQAYPDD